MSMKQDVLQLSSGKKGTPIKLWIQVDLDLDLDGWMD